LIKLDNLTKTFATLRGTVTAVDRVSLEVPAGEICVLLGPSGCGKTTTLKMINRLIMPSSGKIFINGKDTDAYDVVDLRRSIGYVIQQIGLFPNMTVEDNICVVPDLLGWDRAKSRKRAAELLAMVALEPSSFLKRYPKELSGGQQQRVGVIRALAADPPVLLMDEPFGAIDPINREIIQDEFLKMQDQIRKTVMFVSHDIDEAVKMGDRIAIFRDGRLEQFDTPDNVLAHPVNAFIASFVGRDRTLKRLRLVKVADAMRRLAPAIGLETAVTDALRLMDEHAQPMLVVSDAEGRPCGYVACDLLEGRPGIVSEHRRDLPATVDLDEDLRSAVSLMFAHDMRWLACVDSRGLFRGCVTQEDITQLLGDRRRSDSR